MKKKRIYISPPNVDVEETEMLAHVMSEGWISPVGPSLSQFELNLEVKYPSRRVLAVNSGTSALHLSLILSKVGIEDHVLVSTFTFAASVNVILYLKAIPIFIDSEQDSWNLDPNLLEQYLRNTAKKPKALIVTHLYGVPAKMQLIKSICDEFEITLIEDAAEAVGSTLDEIALGQLGDFGILSFNGNKIITTSAGGALITDEFGYEKGLHLSTQANSGNSDYYHTEVGYNYRMSNVLAGIGIVQLRKLDEFIEKKRKIFSYYKEHLSDFFDFPEEPENAFCNRWLTTPLVKGDVEIVNLINHLSEADVESRRLWRPLHLHPAYKNYLIIRNGVSEELYKKGICLPSGTGLDVQELDYVIGEIETFMEL